MADLPPPFHRYWAARAATSTAACILLAALPLLTFELTGSGGWTAAVVAASGLPYLILGLFAGTLADARSRKHIMIWAALACSTLTVALVAARVSTLLTAAGVLVATLVIRSLFVLDDTAHLGAVASLVPVGRIAAANSVLFATASVIELSIPAAAAVLAARAGAVWAVGAAGLAFALSAVMLGRVPGTLSRHTPRARLAVGDGVRWLRAKPLILRHSLLGACQALGQGAVMAAIVPWSAAVTGPDGTPAPLYAAWAGGAIVAAIIVARLPRQWPPNTVMQVAACVPVLSAALAAAANTTAGAALALALWSAGAVTIMLTSLNTRQAAAPAHLRSRINATARIAAAGIGYPTGAILVAAATHTVSYRGVFAIICAALGVLSTLLLAAPTSKR